MIVPQHKVAEGSVGVLKITISHSLEKMCFVCEAIFSTLKLIVALLPYFQVLLSSNNWTDPNKNYWDLRGKFGASVKPDRIHIGDQEFDAWIFEIEDD